MFDESLLTLFGVAMDAFEAPTSDIRLLEKLRNDLQILKCDYVDEKVKTKRFMFPANNTEDIKSIKLTDTQISFVKEFMHIGIVNKETAVEPLSKNKVLLIVRPPFIANIAYEDSVKYLGIKKVRTMIFSVSAEVFHNIQCGESAYDDIIAAAAMSAHVEDWKFIEDQVMSSFYKLITDSEENISNNVKRKIWTELPLTSVDSVWRQMLFLSCGTKDLVHHVQKMLNRNSERLAELMKNEEKELKLIKQTINEYKILYLLVEWGRFSVGGVDSIVLTLKEINATEPILHPSTILEKIRLGFASVVSAAKKHRCNQCEFQTGRKTLLDNHIRLHTGEKPFACKVCEKRFAQRGALIQHMNSHRVIAAFSCNLCGQSFTRRPRLLYHLARHKEKEHTEYKCYCCKKIFVDEDSLKEHVPMHANELKFKCKLCTEQFVNRRELLLHSATHTVKKQFRCKICKKSFRQHISLRNHGNIHTSQGYPCDYCGLSFNVNASRLNHQLMKHEKVDIFNDREDLQRAAKQEKTVDLSIIDI